MWDPCHSYEVRTSLWGSFLGGIQHSPCHAHLSVSSAPLPILTLPQKLCGRPAAILSPAHWAGTGGGWWLPSSASLLGRPHGAAPVGTPRSPWEGIAPRFSHILAAKPPAPCVGRISSALPRPRAWRAHARAGGERWAPPVPRGARGFLRLFTTCEKQAWAPEILGRGIQVSCLERERNQGAKCC